jgi:hypothetical protein
MKRSVFPQYLEAAHLILRDALSIKEPEYRMQNIFYSDDWLLYAEFLVIKFPISSADFICFSSDGLSPVYESRLAKCSDRFAGLLGPGSLRECAIGFLKWF